MEYNLVVDYITCVYFLDKVYQLYTYIYQYKRKCGPKVKLILVLSCSFTKSLLHGYCYNF